MDEWRRDSDGVLRLYDEQRPLWGACFLRHGARLHSCPEYARALEALRATPYASELVDQLVGTASSRFRLDAANIADRINVITFGAAILSGDRRLILAALKEAVEAAIGALKVFRLIFWERFAIMGLDREIDKLVDELNGICAAYARQLQGAEG